jgi:hypothetical protein
MTFLLLGEPQNLHLAIVKACESLLAALHNSTLWLVVFLQIKTRADAVSADPGTLRAVRDRQQQVDQRLQQLLQEHRSSEGNRLQAVRRRQRLLQKAVSSTTCWA